MKKIIAGTLIAGLSISAMAMSKEEIAKYTNNKLLGNDRMVILSGKEIGDNLAILKGFTTAPDGSKIPFQFVTNNKVVITSSGQVFDTETKQEIKVPIGDTSEFKKMATYSIGKGNKEYFLFTEPECPYCKNFHKNFKEENLKDDVKVYVYMYPLNFHFFAKDGAIATLSQPEDKRAAYYSKIISMPEQELIKELEKYSFNLYERILNSMNALNQREAQNSQRYIDFVSKAYNKNFNSRVELIDFCKSKIEAFKKDKARYSQYQKVTKLLDKQIGEPAMALGVSGTPSIYTAEGEQVEGQLMSKILYKN